jgi:hypothetical protein
MGAIPSGMSQTVGGIGNQFTYEENANLRGSKKWTTLHDMENDPHVKGSLRTNQFTLSAAEWDITPASDDPQDILVRDFVAANLLRETNDNFGKMYWARTSWAQRLFEILQMLRDGFSMFAFNMRRVNGRVVYDTIKWLEPESVDPYGWKLDDNDEIQEVLRTYQTSTGRYTYGEALSVSQVALYVWELKGARFEGRPLIRSMYGPWYRKDFIQKMAAIWAQKAGAPTPVGFYPEGWDATKRDAFEDFVRQLPGRSPAEAYGSFPFKDGDSRPDFRFVGAEHDVERGFTELIGSENLEIGHAGGTKSDMLGETQSGSRAVGSIQSDREMLQIAAVAAWVSETEAHGSGNVPGLIERLVDLNFPNVDRYPQLTCSKIDRNEGLDRLEYLPGLVAAGVVPNHPELRRQTTERLGYNLPDEAFEEEPERIAPPQASVPGDDDSEVPEGTPPEQEAEPEPVAASMALESADAFKQRIASMLLPVEGAPIGAGFRPPNALELHAVALVEVRETFRIGERDTLTALREIRSEMVADLFVRLSTGKISTRNLESQRRSAFKRNRWAKGKLQRIFGAVGRVGAGHVDEELERQEGQVDAA